MPVPRHVSVSETVVVTRDRSPVIKIPISVLSLIGASRGDTLYWTVFDDTLQITKVNPRLSIPVIGRVVGKFEPQEE